MRLRDYVFAVLCVILLFSWMFVPFPRPQHLGESHTGMWYAKQMNGKGYVYGGPYKDEYECGAKIVTVKHPDSVLLACREG